MREQCWKDMAYPERQCPHEARWKSSKELCDSQFGAFLRAVRWCDEHKHATDVPIRQEETE